MDNKQIIYTIGYSLFQETNKFNIDLMFKTLQKYNVSYIVDVRSVPYSKQYPQCNAESLIFYGKQYNIPYIHIPELGAKANPTQEVFSKASEIFFTDIFPIPKSNRPEKKELFGNEEIVDFQKFRNDEYFIDGLKRIKVAYEKQYTLALMCSEKDPINCHRYFLVSKGIEERFDNRIKIEHIIKDQNENITTIANDELDDKLVKMILNKDEIKKLDIFNSTFFGPAIVDTYFGNTQKERLMDFCNRYWNLLHGWKKYDNTNSTINYD